MMLRMIFMKRSQPLQKKPAITNFVEWFKAATLERLTYKLISTYSNYPKINHFDIKIEIGIF